jgi:hypothetical protein
MRRRSATTARWAAREQRRSTRLVRSPRWLGNALFAAWHAQRERAFPRPEAISRPLPMLGQVAESRKVSEN